MRQYAVPNIISLLVGALYNIVDQIFIGQGVGYLGNAATTVAFPVMTIIVAFATLLGSGGSAYAAIKLGEQRKEEAQLTLNNLLTLSLAVGILVMLFGLIFLDPPYGTALLEQSLEAIVRFDILSEHGIIICESAADRLLPTLSSPYEMGREYRYGKIKLTVFHRTGSEQRE